MGRSIQRLFTKDTMVKGHVPHGLIPGNMLKGSVRAIAESYGRSKKYLRLWKEFTD